MLHKLTLIATLFAVALISSTAMCQNSDLGNKCQILAKLIADNTARVTIGEDKRREWVNRQPEQFRPFFQLASSQMKIYSRQEFLDEFRNSVLQFQKTLSPNDKIHFIIDDGGGRLRSGHWLLGYLYNQFPELSNFPVSFVSKLTQSAADARLIYVDDALFSGNNLVGALSTIKKVLPNSTIEALVPFATTAALDRAKTLGIKTFVQKRLLTLREKTNLTAVSVPNLGLYSNLSNSNTSITDMSVEFLDHKLPDAQSFSGFYARGNILDTDGTGVIKSRVPFFHHPEPHYQQIDPTTLESERRSQSYSLQPIIETKNARLTIDDLMNRRRKSESGTFLRAYEWAYKKAKLTSPDSLIVHGQAVIYLKELGKGYRARVVLAENGNAFKIPNSARDAFAIENEQEVAKDLNKWLLIYGIKTVPILSAGPMGTYLEKPQLDPSQIASEIVKSKSLSSKQLKALKRIWENSKRYAEDTGIGLDLKASNLFWDGQEWILFDIGPRTSWAPYGFTLDRVDFENYLKFWQNEEPPFGGLSIETVSAKIGK